MRDFIIKHEKGILRALEILPGFVSWNLILFPYWGIFVIPVAVAYFILFFNIYWFYQSFQVATTSIISHTRIQAAKIYNWMADVKGFPDWEKLRHVVIIPTYKEPLHTLERTLDSLLAQDFPQKQMAIIIAQEDRAPEEDKITKMNILKKKYAHKFGDFIVTLHKLSGNEVIGKASNERSAAIFAKKFLVDEKGIDINYLTVTSCDADHVYHPKHFSCLAFKFLDDPNRYKRFWQPAVMFYNNIWEIPAITRVPNTLMTIWNLSQLPRRDRLINAQNYSLSFTLLHAVDYWDADKIPEDWGIFFKAFYKVGGGLEVEPIYLPLLADAAQSTSFWKTIQNQYQQIQRWAWGVSDDPWIIKSYFLAKNVPFWDKTTRLFRVIWSHFLWPVNWFLITIGLTIPTFLNPAFGRTALGYTVPKLSSFILTISLVFLVIMIIIDNIHKPKRPEKFPLWKALLTPLEFVLMPIAGFFFSALPGIDAHTRLMLGKYIEYRVTEKV
ncbi:MAG TPA: glycosyltransferase family 2 protein [Alphaproteobacteria bacterium]|jgi:cellulose synthase/poly-beta-1,6-N-acetylglucosamine synthase-like glycosyltransferase|nr:glycosyltransferase family 2 protein [Alphaproteobacteria bacterium]